MHTSHAEQAAVKSAARQYVDFASVPEHQWPMHDRLTNWARWCRPSSSGPAVSPMFRMVKPDRWVQGEYGRITTVPVDKHDAARIAKGVAALPERHRHAIQWAYLQRSNPARAAQALGQTMQGLADLVRDARQMLVNRGA